MYHQFGARALVAASLLATTTAASAASIAPATSVAQAARSAVPPANHPTPAPASVAAAPAHAVSESPLPPPVVSQDAAARARMHECGHQWSTLKKAGTVGSMTWKEFSATCLVVSK